MHRCRRCARRPLSAQCTFLNTWIEPDALSLITQTLHVNMADAVQYPACERMEKRWGRLAH